MMLAQPSPITAIVMADNGITRLERAVRGTSAARIKIRGAAGSVCSLARIKEVVGASI